jgi:hypothetical protein
MRHQNSYLPLKPLITPVPPYGSTFKYAIFLRHPNHLSQNRKTPCSMAPSSGGGGTSNDMPWRDKDEDLLDWARRAMRYAHAKHYPGNRLKRPLSK